MSGAGRHAPQRRVRPRVDRLCFVADGRSPIARNWIRYFVERGCEAHLISTFPCDASDLHLASVHVVPVAFGARAGGVAAGRAAARGAAAGGASAGRARPAVLGRLAARARTAFHPAVLGWVSPFEFGRHVAPVRALVRELAPTLVHAMRLPYEGFLAARALAGTSVPLVTSVWGNDLELWAARYPLIGRLTREALARTTALHPDCARDLALARAWGWTGERPAAVIPTNGGVRTDVFRPGRPDARLLRTFGIAEGAPLVLNPRGVRGYVRNDTFFRAVPLVLARRPDAVFAGVAMAGHPAAERWVRSLGVGGSVRLLPPVPPATMAALFRAAAVAVSPTTHDGTPNTLLEAMACGAFPVAGDLAPVREWVEDGRNGLLVDPADPRALADAVLRGLDDAPLRARAAECNAALVAERAEYTRGMARAEALYAAAAADAGRVPAAA